MSYFMYDFFEYDVNIWILTISFMISVTSSCLLYYYCLNWCDAYVERESKLNRGRTTAKARGTTTTARDTTMQSSNNDGDCNLFSGESTHLSHFESSFWLTILSTLFNDDGTTDGIDCGIILIPNAHPIEDILNSIFRGCLQCKVPVTEQFLKHYGKTSRKANSYIIVECGYIYGYEVYHENIYNVAKANGYIVIDSQKKKTQKSNHEYYRIFVNNVRVKSADQFCSVFAQYGIDINLQNDDTTTTWKVRESVEISPEVFENKAEGMAATNLANSLHYLQERRTHRTQPEMVGATIVVIPFNKSLADFKLYLRQYLSVSMPISDSCLYCIFSHNSVLHDGAIFVRGNRIIAVKAFFRITGEYKNKPSIGHGTRHASAQEFSKHAGMHKPITFVLSEEDGLIRSCIIGEIKKINYTFVPRLVIEYHDYQHTEEEDEEEQKQKQKQKEEGKPPLTAISECI